MWALNSEGHITLAEGLLLEQLGLTPGELVGRSQSDVYSHSPEFCDMARSALRGEACNATQKLGRFILDVWYSPLRDRHGRLAGAIGVALDVTERHRRDEQSIQAQKMQAVGRLASGVAHDFNNLLTAILGFAEMALDQLSSGQVRDDVEQVVYAGQSAAALTNQLLTFSRMQTVHPRVFDLNPLVRGIECLLRRVIGEDVILVTSYHTRMSRIARPDRAASDEPGRERARRHAFGRHAADCDRRR
jgi:PAS domain S-box-containing protein